jgi:hypothetical protein
LYFLVPAGLARLRAHYDLHQQAVSPQKATAWELRGTGKKSRVNKGIPLERGVEASVHTLRNDPPLGRRV